MRMRTLGVRWPDSDRHLDPPTETEDPLEHECPFCDRAPGKGYGYLRVGYICPACNREVER